MKIAQELRAGSTIKIGNDPFVVLKAEYNKSGRNAAVVKFKMKNLISGNISDAVYKADDKMDDIKLDKVKAIYSYQNGDSYIFSNPETWEEIELKGLYSEVFKKIRFFPSKVALPSSGETNPSNIFIKVDLPDPFGPINAVISPSFAVNETSERTLLLLKPLLIFSNCIIYLFHLLQI